MAKISSQWLSKMTFEASVNGHSVTMDADSSVGGEDRGPRPKPLLLVSLAGCTGMDVISLLNKMRVSFSGLKINVSGELTEEHPKIYKKIHIAYIITGKDIDKAKVEKAVVLSQDKYCGVSAMLKKASEITYQIDVITE
jgi:putative redox protein